QDGRLRPSGFFPGGQEVRNGDGIETRLEVSAVWGVDADKIDRRQPLPLPAPKILDHQISAATRLAECRVVSGHPIVGATLIEQKQGSRGDPAVGGNAGQEFAETLLQGGS